MKLLFDENLSRKLVVRLAELYPGSAHVAEVELLESPDREIWDFAKAGGFLIVSTDVDFYELATTMGPPPKVVWLRRWTHPTRDAERVLRRDAIRIAEFVADPELATWFWIVTDASRAASSDVPSRLVGSNFCSRPLPHQTSRAERMSVRAEPH